MCLIISCVTGVKNLMNCPKEPNIPIYLFVGGSFGLLKLVQVLWEQWRKQRKDSYDQDDFTDNELGADGNVGSIGLNGSSKFIDCSISIFLLVWFCLGNYWVSGIKIYSLLKYNSTSNLLVGVQNLDTQL